MELFQKEETTGLAFQKATSPVSCTLIFYRYNYLIKLCNYVSSSAGINRIGNKYRWLLALIQWKRKARRSFWQSQVSFRPGGCECVQLHLDIVERKWQHYYPCETWTWELPLSFLLKYNGCEAGDVFQSYSSQWQLPFFPFPFSFFSHLESIYRYLWECGFNRSLDFVSLLLSSKMQQKHNESTKVYGERVLSPSSSVGRLH